MTQTPTHWLPGIIVLGGGLLLAVLYLLATRKKGAPAAAKAAAPTPATGADEQLANLERRYQQRIEQLKELVADQHHLPAEQFQAEKTRLELEAAAALRERDEYLQGASKREAKKAESAASGKQPAPAPAPTGFFGRHPELKGAVWGGGVVAFFVVLGLLISQNSKPRGENESATGQVPPNERGNGSQVVEEDEQLKSMVAEVTAHPENVEAAAIVGHELLRRQQFDQANSITERALGVDPFHVENRIHHALLLAIRGDTGASMAQLQHLADTYPDAQEALLFLGSIAGQSGDLRRALDCFERFAAEAPPEDQPPQLAEGIARLRSQLGTP